MTGKIGVADYPISEKRPELVAGKRGKPLDELTLEAVVAGRVSMDDLSITANTLRLQGEISKDSGRPTLQQNFERAAELVDVPPDEIMRIYELLRPGRARSKAELLDTANLLNIKYKAPRIAAFVEEAAEVYERRGLFVKRF